MRTLHSGDATPSITFRRPERGTLVSGSVVDFGFGSVGKAVGCRVCAMLVVSMSSSRATQRGGGGVSKRVARVLSLRDWLARPRTYSFSPRRLEAAELREPFPVPGGSWRS